jgi:hypothetical protein
MRPTNCSTMISGPREEKLEAASRINTVQPSTNHSGGPRWRHPPPQQGAGRGGPCLKKTSARPQFPVGGQPFTSASASLWLKPWGRRPLRIVDRSALGSRSALRTGFAKADSSSLSQSGGRAEEKQEAEEKHENVRQKREAEGEGEIALGPRFVSLSAPNKRSLCCEGLTIGRWS